MPPPPHGDELASFPQSIPHPTQLDSPPQIPPDPQVELPLGMDNYDSLFPDEIEIGKRHSLNLSSPLPDFQGDSWGADDHAVLMEALRDGRRPCGPDADMLGVNDDVDAPQAAHPVHLCGGGHGHGAAPCCATATAEIQHLGLGENDAQRRLECVVEGRQGLKIPSLFEHAALADLGLEEKDAQWRLDSFKQSDVDQEQRLFGELDPLAAPDEKLVEEDGHPSCRDANMSEVNEAAPQPGPLSEVLDQQRPFISAILQDLKGLLLLDGKERLASEVDRHISELKLLLEPMLQLMEIGVLQGRKPGRKPHQPRWSVEVVRFSGPGKNGHQPGWKEKSMTGMPAVADPPPPPPPLPPGQQEQRQRYVGLKKTLEWDDGNGNEWRAHEYTPLLPSDDGSDKLVPAEMSLRVEFKVDEPTPSEVAAATSTKRKEDEPPQEAPAFGKRPKMPPKKSPVWKHMTPVHVKVASTTNKDETQRKKNPHYKVMYAICNHCDQVFNADSSRHGTHSLSTHLDRCNDCKCTHSHSP